MMEYCMETYLLVTYTRALLTHIQSGEERHSCSITPKVFSDRDADGAQLRTSISVRPVID